MALSEALLIVVLLMLMIALLILGKVLSAVKGRQQIAQPDRSPRISSEQGNGAGYIEQAIPNEVVAAIAAAVAIVEEGPHMLTSIRRVAHKNRGSWGQAGVLSATQPFLPYE